MRLTIGGKLIIAFAVIVVMSGIIGAFGIVQIERMAVSESYLYDRMTKPLSNLITLAEDFELIRVHVQAYAVEEDKASWTANATAIDRLETEIRAVEPPLQASIDTDAGQKDFSDYKKNFEDYAAVVSEITRLTNDGKRSEATVLMTGRASEVAAALQSSVDRIVGASDSCVGRVKKVSGSGILVPCKTRNSTRSCSG